MFNTILVPIDLAHANEGKANIDIAVKQAGADAKIILLNVVEEIPNWAAVAIPDTIISDSQQTARTTTSGLPKAKTIPDCGGR